MTGWRIGYLCATAKVTDLLFKVHAFAVTDIATFVQDAAEAALKAGDEATKEMDAQYIKRRDYMYKRLTEMGFECSQPMGAFYIFAKIPPFLDQDDNKLIYQLANECQHRFKIVRNHRFKNVLFHRFKCCFVCCSV